MCLHGHDGCVGRSCTLVPILTIMQVNGTNEKRSKRENRSVARRGGTSMSFWIVAPTLGTRGISRRAMAR